MKIDILALIGALGGLVGAGGGYLFAHRKNRAEAKLVEAAVVSDNLLLYQKLIDDLSQRFEARLKDIQADYEQKIIDLENEIDQLRKELQRYKTAS